MEQVSETGCFFSLFLLSFAMMKMFRGNLTQSIFLGFEHLFGQTWVCVRIVCIDES